MAKQMEKLLFLLLLPALCYGATYYIDPAGNDTTIQNLQFNGVNFR